MLYWKEGFALKVTNGFHYGTFVRPLHAQNEVWQYFSRSQQRHKSPVLLNWPQMHVHWTHILVTLHLTWDSTTKKLLWKRPWEAIDAVRWNEPDARKCTVERTFIKGDMAWLLLVTGSRSAVQLNRRLWSFRSIKTANLARQCCNLFFFPGDSKMLTWG